MELHRYEAAAVKKICVISQPTFLPWLGWFDLVDQVDFMVLLDDVGFSKRSWQQRNRLRTPSGLEFVSVPVKSTGRRDQLIMDCELADPNFAAKLIGTLRSNYGRAPYFQQNIDEISTLLKTSVESNRLVELNCSLIGWMAGKLGVATPMIRASKIAADGRRGEHLAEICKLVEADVYLSTPGAEEYLIQDRHAFEQRGIGILIHVYEHPTYAQLFAPPFLPYASALDLILNVGPEAREVMQSGRRAARDLGKRSTGNNVELQHENRQS